jgi:hypothetical protein
VERIQAEHVGVVRETMKFIIGKVAAWFLPGGVEEGGHREESKSNRALLSRSGWFLWVGLG